MSKKEESPDDEEDEEPEVEPEEEEIAKEAKTSLKRENLVPKITTQIEPTSESEMLNSEIVNLLKKARAAIAEEQFSDAVKLYREAAVASDMMGQPENEKTYLNRANEILTEHPEIEKGLATEPIKKRKGKAKLRKEEEKLTFSRLITRIFVAGIFTILVFSGIFAAMILQKLLEMGGSYNVPQLWYTCIIIEIIGLVIAYIFGTRWLKWPE